MSGRWTAGVRREVLPNGLTVLVRRDDSAPVVAVVTLVKAGFFDEPDRWVGISHVLEHMFFKGTPRRGVGAVARETKAAGGYLNASTTYDHTTYFVVLPATGLDTALDIQADALRNSVIDAGELTRELQVIIQEAKRKLDDSSSVTHETLHEVMFDRHRIRRWRIGREADLARFTREDVRGYYKTRYVPERTIVAIVGAVDEAEALARAHATYGDWPAAAGAHDPSPEEPPRRDVRARTLRGDVSQAEVALGWRAVPPLHPDAAPLDLAAAVLGSGRGSWLYRALRETSIASSVSAYNYSPTELGIFGASVECRPEQLPAVLDAIATAVAQLTLLGPPPADLERARTLLLARWARRMEPMEGRASALAGAEALGGIEILDREYDSLATLGADAVRAAAARYLVPDGVSAVAYLPRGEGLDLTGDAVARAFAVTALAPPTPPRVPEQERRRARPVSGETFASVWHTALSGTDLLVRPKAGVPTVTLGIYAARDALDPPEFAGLGALAVRSAVRGAGGLDAAGVAFAFERLGGTLGPSAASDWLGFGTSVLGDRLGEAAALLDLVFRQPTLADADVAAEQRVMVAEAEQVADDMFRYPFQLAFGAAFGNEGYGMPVSGTPETLAEITAAAVRRRAAGMGTTRPVIIAVGDIDPERAAAELAGIFDAYPPRKATPRPSALAWALDGTPISRLVTRDKAQTALAMLFQGPARREPARFAADVWSAVASGLGGRMFEALRDRRSLAYTVTASAWQKARAGALVSYIATSPEREEEARGAMLAELERFAREEVSPEELRRAVNYLAGQSEVQRQSAGAVAGEILDAWISGEGLGELAEPAAFYRAVTAEAVWAVAARNLNPARRAEGIVRGAGGGR